ncbi:MAG: A/G-specific adenine glycosylase [Pseudomonadota bacterium]
MNLPEAPGEFAGELLAWFEGAARPLPWRVMPADRARGVRPDPYGVWLSEIMLQQTTIAHGTRYWLDFTRRWPNVQALAGAEDSAVMAAWAGLGYYARARNLLKCARQVAASGGRFPQTARGLQALPGIGPYTAGAIAAIAFGQRAPAVDGNVDRVMARLLALEGPWPEQKKQIADSIERLVPADRPGEFAEAMMDLGATICTPKRANCLVCPVTRFCAARRRGGAERYPIKPAKAKKPVRRGAVLVLEAGGRVRLETRPEKGLLGGMLALPTTEWTGQASDAGAGVNALAGALGADRSTLSRIGEVRHVFTHFHLTLDVWRAGAPAADGGDWRAPEAVSGLPSVFAKAFRLAYPSSPISAR